MIEALLVDRLPAVMNRGPGGFWTCTWSLPSLSCVCLGAVCGGDSAFSRALREQAAGASPRTVCTSACAST